MTHMLFIKSWRIGLLLISCFLGTAQAAPSSTPLILAGEIAFINGQVVVQNPLQPTRQLQTGSAVYVGDQIQTLANSHLHLRMVDNAFVALRPASQLTIEAYDYHPNHPQASRIRMDLQHGTSRAVTGKGGQAAKHQYRFNTPLAAIGLRGTDYTVIADAEKTRVSVAQGGVIVSPFTADCTNTQLGPCTSPLARELTAGMPTAYIEITSQQKPGVIINESAPRPAVDGGGKDVFSVNSIRQAQTEVTSPESLAAAARGIDTQAPDTQAHARWGRWSSLVQQIPQGSGSINQVLGALAPYTLVTSNNAFALDQADKVLPNLPEQGRVNLVLNAAEAYTQQAGLFAPAKVISGAFEMDFAQNTFNTQMAVVTNTAQTEKIQAQGRFDVYGRMQSLPSQSNANVKGVILGSGQEAAYLFDKTLSSGSILSGAAQWGR